MGARLEQRTFHARGAPVAEGEARTHRAVDSRARELRVSTRDVGLCAGFSFGHGAGYGADLVDRVTADVHRRTAREVELVPDVVPVREDRDHPCGDVVDRAEGPDELEHAREQRVVAVVERLHHDLARARGGVGDRLRFGGVRGERLLAQHVLAGLERGDRPLTVQAVGKGL